ncbi:hypothetical protein CRUP_005261 [Coryphaenoides rupestris]|nr:hypothetical protein CRUP_005261 [Coryphaenoides rupestris]
MPETYLLLRNMYLYSLGTAGNVEHGAQYQLKLVYEHNLQRTACNMTSGPFGGGTGTTPTHSHEKEKEKEEEENVLEGLVLLGWGYETLAVATEAESRQDPELPLKTGGKRLTDRWKRYAASSPMPPASELHVIMYFRLTGLCRRHRPPPFVGLVETKLLDPVASMALSAEVSRLLENGAITPDWTVVLGEAALDLSVPSFSHASSCVCVLGERNLYCFLTEGTVNLLLGNHNNMLLVYQDVTLQWAAQLACVPVAVRLANFSTHLPQEEEEDEEEDEEEEDDDEEEEKDDPSFSAPTKPTEGRAARRPRRASEPAVTTSTPTTTFKPRPAAWSVEDVTAFIHTLPGCSEVAEGFRMQEIDGQALLLLTEDHLMTSMNIKLGPALKICAHINALKNQ